MAIAPSTRRTRIAPAIRDPTAAVAQENSLLSSRGFAFLLYATSGIQPTCSAGLGLSLRF